MEIRVVVTFDTATGNLKTDAPGLPAKAQRLALGLAVEELDRRLIAEAVLQAVSGGSRIVIPTLNGG